VIIASYGEGLVDSVWDEDIVSDHGIASSSGLVVGALNLTARSFNGTLDAILGVADLAGRDLAGQVWEELLADHNTALTMGAAQNTTSAVTLAAIADSVWDEDIVAAHGTADTGGLLLRALGAAISQRSNNATLNALLGVADAASTNLADAIWDEDVVAAHSTADTAGLLVRALGAAISQRSNNATLHALLGVADVASADVAWTIWDEVVDGSNHTTANSAGQRLTALDTLTESGGAGDLAAIKTSTDKIDSAAATSPATSGSLAHKIDSLITSLSSAKGIVASLNLEGSALRIECAVEAFGIIQTTPYVQCQAQIFDEAGAIIETIGIGDFGSINARGYFGHTLLSHGLVAGTTYQVFVRVDDGATDIVSTSKVFRVIQG
jgi:hypothetical protein